MVCGADWIRKGKTAPYWNILNASENLKGGGGAHQVQASGMTEGEPEVMLQMTSPLHCALVILIDTHLLTEERHLSPCEAV